MIANLRDYEPSIIEFVIPEAIRETFPPVLFEGSTNVDEIIKLVNENFNATFPESEISQRVLDAFEIDEIREEYCIKQENEVPKRERELLEAIERAKKIKSDAQERLAAIKTEIKDLAAEVKKGTKDYQLSSKNTVRFALNGYFIYYSWVNGQLTLVKGEKSLHGISAHCGLRKTETVKPCLICSALNIRKLNVLLMMRMLCRKI